MKRFYVISGGTFNYVDSHLILGAPAFGSTGRVLKEYLVQEVARSGDEQTEIHLVLTRMAIGGSSRGEDDKKLLASAGLKDLKTNQDLQVLVDYLVSLGDTKCIVMAAGVVDFECTATNPSYGLSPGKEYPRLPSSKVHQLSLLPTHKILRNIRKTRKDIFLVAFKQTTQKSPDELYVAGLGLLKRNSANLVLANDTQNYWNMVITPEQARYFEGSDRHATLKGLAEMIVARSQLTFTRSTVKEGNLIPWASSKIPDSLRTVVDYCVNSGAYKPFNGKTVGHFAVKFGEKTFGTSRRGANFNEQGGTDLVLIETDGADRVIAWGGSPSVGGQSQRLIFGEHPQMDCIVHFHCPKKTDSRVPYRSQKEYECGSHECGKNTSVGLASFENGEILAVMLDKHGPNIVFNRNIDPQKVINFIEANFDLKGRTDELHQLQSAHAFS